MKVGVYATDVEVTLKAVRTGLHRKFKAPGADEAVIGGLGDISVAQLDTMPGFTPMEGTVWLNNCVKPEVPIRRTPQRATAT